MVEPHVFPSWTHNPGRMVFTLYIYKDGSLLKTSLLDVYITAFVILYIGRTLYCALVWSVLGGGGGGGGTFYPSGGQFALVQNVRGDILHGGTIRPPTPALPGERYCSLDS